MTITVNDLEPVPAQSGSVTVRIAGQNEVITPEKSVTISEDPMDLAAKRYVRYNNGGYTVLHALIDACSARFTCSSGNFTPEVDIDETAVGDHAGWVCEVNGKICDDPANTLAEDGDKIDFYYNSDYADMRHVRFAEEAIRVKEGSSVELTLLGAPVGDETPTAIAGAEIYVGEELVGSTDAEGKITVPAAKLSEKRDYFVTAKEEDGGENTLTCAVVIITVEKDPDLEPAIPGYTTVSFHLIGDTNHGEDINYHDYSTWIGTTSYAFEGDEVSVGDVFTRALTDAGLSYEGLSKNYIESITAPDGSSMQEFTNGVNSGWMYTVNGVHVGNGLNDVYVSEGDEIVWHYVDDFNLECRDGITGTTTGNTATWNTWFDAADGPAINAGAIVTLEDAEIVKDETTFTATLPAGSEYPTADQIKITPEDANATVSDLQTADEGKTWTFKVTAEIGTTTEYELDVMIEEAPVVPNITIINSSETPLADVTATVEDGTVKLHVEADKPCVVILKKADGSYERLEATKNGDGYDFSQADYDDSMEFIIAAKGDYDGNGKFNTNDLAKANKDIVAKKTIDPLMILIMDGSGETLRPNALAKLKRDMVNQTMTW